MCIDPCKVAVILARF